MFDRFTEHARASVTSSMRIAEEVGARQIEPLHLLTAVAESNGPGGAALDFSGVESADLRAAMGDDPLDADALATLGIDLEEVRAQAEHEFGQGALDRAPRRTRRGRLPLSRSSKAALGKALKQAAGHSSRRLDTGHLVLGLLDVDDDGVRSALASAEVEPDELRRDVERRIAASAA
ncbi:MAG TPA: Clp protease N-terminal domain-containing protein [Nocardioidaceae bacterium]|nr:Clp protease N-terminal domain-containing protein [Nocardioidaceae bacterium]